MLRTLLTDLYTSRPRRNRKSRAARGYYKNLLWGGWPLSTQITLTIRCEPVFPEPQAANQKPDWPRFRVAFIR